MPSDPVGQVATPAAPPVSRSQKPENPPSTSAIRQTVFEAVPEAFPDTANAHVSVRIRAHVNGVPIFDEEIRDACFPLLINTLNMPEPERSQQQSEIFRAELQMIIDREVLLQDAFAKLNKNGPQYLEKLEAAANKEFDRMVRSIKARSGAKTDEELKNILQNQGQSLDAIRRQVTRNFMAREYVRSRIYPAIERIGHQQILEYYQAHGTEFLTVDSVKWNDIFVDASKYPNREEARKFAEQLANKARGGEAWTKLSQYDNGDSSYRNGEGFGQKHGEIKPLEAEGPLFSLKDGEVGPVVEISTGFHVIKLVKRVYAGKVPLDEKTQDEIRKKIQNQVADLEAKRLLAELKQKASIEISPKNP
jgi:parvulin-like peptidyl-prolyl isomerase